MADILLIEPDLVLAGNLAKLLKKAGHRVDWQVDLQAAIDSADKRPPQAVIMDLLLAGRSGIEFLYEFRSYPEWQNLPVVLFSSISPEELGATLENLNSLGIAGYYYKPVTPLAELAEAVTQLASQPVVVK